MPVEPYIVKYNQLVIIMHLPHSYGGREGQSRFPFAVRSFLFVLRGSPSFVERISRSRFGSPSFVERISRSRFVLRGSHCRGCTSHFALRTLHFALRSSHFAVRTSQFANRSSLALRSSHLQFTVGNTSSCGWGDCTSHVTASGWESGSKLGSE